MKEIIKIVDNFVNDAKGAKDKPANILVEEYDLYNTLAIVHQYEGDTEYVAHTEPMNLLE